MNIIKTKKSLITFILISLNLLGYGQDTKRVKKKIKKYNEIEYYDVRKSDKQVKQGKYYLKWNWKFYHYIKTEGQYNNGNKQGEWIYYYDYAKKYRKDPRPEYIVNYQDNQLNGKYIHFSIYGDTLETGSYKNGYRSGIWQIYHSNTLIEYYDFSSGKSLLEPRHRSKLDISPKLINGLDISRYIYKNVNLNPPNKDSSDVKLGRIQVKFVVDTDSTVKSIDLQKYSDEYIAKNFVKCIKKTKWEPAIRNGNVVPSETTILIIYRIEWQGNGKNWIFDIADYFPRDYLFKPI